MATRGMVRNYALRLNAAPPRAHMDPPTPMTDSPYNEDMAEAFAVNWAYKLGYNRALDRAQKLNRMTRFMP